MELIIFWALASYGMTSIIVWGSIFDRPRNWIKSHSEFFGSLVTCVQCASTWIGFFMSICLGGLSNNIFISIPWPLVIFFDGMFTTGVVWAINSIVEFFEENRLK